MSMPPPTPSPVASAIGSLEEHDAGQRSSAMLAHILGIFGILGTGIYYLIKKDKPDTGPFVRDQMKEAFNFHLAIFVLIIVLQILSAIIVGVTKSAALAGLIGLVMLVVYVGVLVLLIMAAIKANKGVAARYPIKIPALK